jgi:hypothetical protein
MNEITASSDTLVDQAPATAETYLRRAIEDIDNLLGEGYAKAHPELIAAYMQTAALDYGASIIAQQIRAGLGDSADALRAHGSMNSDE